MKKNSFRTVYGRFWIRKITPTFNKPKRISTPDDLIVSTWRRKNEAKN